MKTKLIFLSVILVIAITSTYGQKSEQDSTFRRHFIGTSGFMLANLGPNPPSFYQINFGYWLTKRDVISIEAKTWTYKHPLGIPYGSSFQSTEYEYPGYIREYGVGIAYQRYLWKDLYTAIHAVPFLQKYVDKEGKKIQNGFQLFMTGRIGYHVRLFKDRFFIEPSLAVTYWPINTNTPAGFKKLEDKWPNYFLFEPGFHLGVKF